MPTLIIPLCIEKSFVGMGVSCVYIFELMFTSTPLSERSRTLSVSC
jgi:hypothetical protein